LNVRSAAAISLTRATDRGGNPALGECLACDAYFDVAPADVFAAPSLGA
jgi:hypothetical protein